MFFVKLWHYRVMLMVVFLQVIKLFSSLITDWNKDFNSWTCHLGSKVIRKCYWNCSISYSFRLYMKKMLFKKKSQNQAEFHCCLLWFSFLSNVFTIFTVKHDSQFGSQNDRINVQVRSCSSAQTPVIPSIFLRLKAKVLPVPCRPLHDLSPGKSLMSPATLFHAQAAPGLN